MLPYIWLHNENHIYESGDFTCFSSLLATGNLQNGYVTSLKNRLLHTKVLQSLSPLGPSCQVPKAPPPCASFQNLKCTGPQLWGSKNSEKYDKIPNFS
jgi:hypothetical protein